MFVTQTVRKYGFDFLLLSIIIEMKNLPHHSGNFETWIYADYPYVDFEIVL
jgi:hypothetical protein